MKRKVKLIVLLGLLLSWGDIFGQNVTNRGKEFWVGYGHHQFMEKPCAGGNEPNNMNMVIYLSAEAQPAVVTVTIDSSGNPLIPGSQWVKTYNVPAYSVIPTDIIPKGVINVAAVPGEPLSDPNYDARLITDAPPAGTGGAGIFRKKGIHITSDVPIVAYSHIYGSASSGASMLLPVDTWGYSYVSVNSKQSYAANCYNWTYVLANHDSTLIEITPSVLTRAQNLTGLVPGAPKYVYLMKGQIYQLIGASTGADANGNNPCGGGGSTGRELTGTKIRSVANASGNCYPVAVFAGSSRTTNPASCGSGGGDNDNQQCFPTHVWGKRYLLAPTSQASSASAFQTNTFKIAVKDPTTVVRRNGTPIPLGSLLNNSYYTFESNQPELIEADKPVFIGQFMTGGNCGGGSIGDPEMIFVSPIEQGIKRIGFYRNDKQGISVNYLTLIIPTNGVPSLRINGVAPPYDHSYPHPGLAGYTVVVKRWNAAQSQALVSADSAFTAITYGLGSVESYGYNAGTYLNNLNAVSSIHNVLDPTTPQHAFTCTGTPVELSVLMAYQPTKMDWLLSQLGPALSPNADVIDNAPVSTGTVVVNGITYYKYTLPGTYTFNTADTFDIPINAYNPVIENCYNREQLTVQVIVKGKPSADYTFTHTGCTLDTIYFNGTATTTNGFTIRDFNWTFPGPTTATGQTVNKVLPPGTYTIDLAVVSNEGCVGDTSKQITIFDKPPANFQVAPASLCDATSFTLTDTSSATIAVNEWYWDFGNGVTQTVTSGPSVSYTYPLPGTYIIKHVSRSSATCVSDTISRQVTVYANPVVSFTNSASGCLDVTGLVQFTGTATVADGQAITGYAWNFGDPNATAGNPNTSTLQNPSHNFQQGTYTIIFNATTANGCMRGDTVNVTFNLKPQLSYPAINPVCANNAPLSVASALVTNGVAGPPGGMYKGPGTTTAGMFDPSIAGAGVHTIWYVFTTNAGCIDSVSSTVTVNPVPAKPIALNPVDYCQNSTAAALSATALPGNTLTWFNNPALTGGSPVAPTPSTATAGTFYYYVNQTTTATGCTSDTSRISVLVYTAITGNAISADQTICSGTSPATLVSAGTLAGGSGVYAYQWQQSTDGGANWTNIAGATLETLAPAAVTGVTQFRRVVTSSLCSGVSNVVTITVQGSMTSYDISADQTICAGSTPVLLDGQTPVGGSGVFTYQWESSLDGTSWTTVGGATAEDYQPPVLTTTTYYRRKVSSGACAAISTAVLITVNAIPNGAITGNATICSYNTADVVFTATAGVAPFNVTITVNGPSGTNTITQAVANNGPVNIPVIPLNSAAGTYTVTLSSIGDNTGCSRTTGLSVLTITVNAKPVLTLTPNTAICINTSTTLTAGGATTYTWSPATGLSSTSGSSVSANPAATTTYQVIGITNGCNDTALVTVTVNPRPSNPTSTVSITYCQNATATALAATGDPGNTIMWYNNPGLTGGSTIAPAPPTTVAGTFNYYVTQINAFNCESAPTVITVTVLPTLTNFGISADQSICAGAATTALASSGTPAGGDGTYAYQWWQSTDNGANWNIIAGATGATYNAGSPAITTQYRRDIISGGCNSTSNVVTITVTAQITNFAIAANQTICAGTSPAPIDGQTPGGGNGTFNYQWESSPDCTTWTAIPGATAEDYQPGVLLSTTSFKRKVISGACEAESGCITITVNEQPNGAITASSTVCSYDGANVTFTASAGTAPFTVLISVNGPSGTTTVSQVVPNNGPATINVIPANSVAGSYTVTLTSITDNIGCAKNTGLSSLPVVVNAKPNVVLSPDVPICEGSSTTLTANGAATYAWSPATGLSGTTGNSVTANPITTTTYRVIGVTNNCSDTSFVTVTVNPRPVNAPLPAINYCQNATASPLTATPAPNHSLTWYDNPGLTNGTTTAPVPSTITPGTTNYYVTQTNNATGCVSNPSMIIVNVNPVPVVNFDVPLKICMPGGVATFNNLSSAPDNSTLTYQWNFGDGTGTSTATHPSYVYGAIGSYNVTLTATSALGCVTTSAPKVVNDFYDKPIAMFTVTPDELCQGVNTTFVDGSSAPNSTIQSWSWNFDDGSPIVTVQTPVKQFPDPGTFNVTLTVTNAAGCVSNPYPRQVRVHLQPVIDAGRSFVVPLGDSIRFQATANSPSLTFSWSPATSMDDATLLKPTIKALADETYTLTATGEFGCTSTDFITVKILKPVKVPNVFSPNGDGIHDKWLVPNLADYPGCKVEIFNRYGQAVFVSQGYGTPWDGTYRGKDMPVGTYYYVITLENGFKPITGSVTIVR